MIMVARWLDSPLMVTRVMIAVLMGCAEFSHYDELAPLFRLVRSRDYTQHDARRTHIK